MTACPLLACAVLPPLLASPAAAQAQGYTTSVRFANLTPFPRLEWGTASVPFPEGAWPAGTQYRAAGGLTHELVPFGARWPDGSVRFARLDVALGLAAGQRREVRIEPGAPTPTGPFTFGPMTRAKLPRFDMQVVVGVPGVGPRGQGLRVRRIVHRSDTRLTVLFGGRIADTDLVLDLWLTWFTGQDTAHFEFRLTNSNPRSTRWQQDVEYIALAVRDALPSVRYAVRYNTPTSPPDASGWCVSWLRGADRFYDGQGYEWRGELLFSDRSRVPNQEYVSRLKTHLAAVTEPLKGVAANWPQSGAFGPFGYVPDFPPWIRDNGDADIARLRARFLGKMATPVADPWEDRELGLVRDASTTGDQYDFGAAKLVDVFRTGRPDRVEEIRWNAGEEAARPMHYHEWNGDALQAVDHPDWVAWSGRTHFNRVVSPDRLGKPFPEPFLGNQAHGWSPKDRQHWSSLTLASAYLLTLSDSLRYELECEAELFKAEHTLPSRKPGWATNTVAAPRGIGRAFNSMAWNYLLTGERELRDWMVARVDEVIAPGRIGARVQGPVRPIVVFSPDARILPVDHWRPWEEAQAVLGLEACARVTGSTNARLVAYDVAKTLATYAWKRDASGSLIATGMAWLPDGAPLSPAQRDDRNFVLWSYGTGFSEWSLPATHIGYNLARRFGDNDLEQRSLAILGDLYASRTAPRTNGWDRFAEWEHAR